MTSMEDKMYYIDIEAERDRQREKWGDQSGNTLPIWMTILGEEFGEVAKEVLDGEYFSLREELVQLAAVAVAMIEAIDIGEVRWR